MPDRPYFIENHRRLYYATEDELLEFANRVREAGGANILDALLPSRPGVANACLIANALNFSCEVECIASDDEGFDVWAMVLPGNTRQERAEAIAKAVGCPLEGQEFYSGEFEYSDFYVKLPRHIGHAAYAFDERKGWTTKYAQREVRTF